MATSTRKPKGKVSSAPAKSQPQSGAPDETAIATAGSKPRRSPKTQAAAAEQLVEATPAMALEQASEEQATNGNGNSATHEVIERRAYEIFIARGGEHGWDQEDWFRAEEEIRNRGGEES
jgi:hypothetical protein